MGHWIKHSHIFSEALFKRTADRLVSDGYLEAGYEYIIIDDCWADKSRDADNRLRADPDRFPNGIAALAEYVSLEQVLIAFEALRQALKTLSVSIASYLIAVLIFSNQLLKLSRFHRARFKGFLCVSAMRCSTQHFPVNTVKGLLVVQIELSAFLYE